MLYILGIPPPGSESNISIDTHKDQQQGDSSNTRSDSMSFIFLAFLIRYIFIYLGHPSHRENDNRYRDRDSHKSNRGGFNRSSSFNRYISII